MNHFKKYIMCTLFLSVTMSGFAAADVRQAYVIELLNLAPETILPTLTPLLEDGDSISGINHELIIITSPERIDVIRDLVNKLDKPLRNLLIAVKNNNDSSSTENSSGLSGGIRQGKVYIGTGKPIPAQQDGITIRSEGLAYSTNTTQQTTTSRAEQQVRAIEGSPAFIHTGESRQFSTRDAYGNIQSTEVNANKGFYVTARLAGDRVLLDISVSNDEFDQPASSLSEAAMSTQRLSTTVSGQVGEWISLGGVTLSDKNSEKSLAKKITARSTSLGDISVKISPLNQ